MKRILLLLVLICVSVLNAQIDIATDNGNTVYTCSDTFYDSGVNSNYANNENYTITICPDPANPGTFTQLDFSSFSVEGGTLDFMTVYNGPNTGSPLMGTYTANPGTLVSSDASGCLTISFQSDSSLTYSGWEAAISCFAPCSQTVTSNLLSTTPAVNGSGVIGICQGDSVNFVGSGTFSNSGAGATYTWDFGDGTTGNGTNVSHTYTTGGVYLVNLNITVGSCTSTNKINQIVHVAPNPDFTGTAAVSDPICQGDTSVINGVVAPQSISVNCAPPNYTTTFLPDSSTGVYQTCFTVDCYPNTTNITSVTDIVNVFMNLEHTYLGDLGMTLTAPNGASVVLLDNASIANTGANLGDPIQTDGTGPGTGWDYYFLDAQPQSNLGHKIAHPT